MSGDVVYPQVVVNTRYGHFMVELYGDKAPLTVANFLVYVDAGHYAGTIFHRVLDQFVIQGGGFTTLLEAKPTLAPIALESANGLSNLRGSLAMARTQEADSATAQFYINTVDNLGLDFQSAASPGYAVFGQVTDGMAVVDAIGNAHTFNVRVGTTASYPNLPFPLLIDIFSAERYLPASSLTVTTYAIGINDHGVQVMTFAGARADYGVRLEAEGARTVTLLDGAHASAPVSAPRLYFDDMKLAYDVEEAAGSTARLINAAFGHQYLTSWLNGIGISLFDQGFSMETVAGLALGTGLWSSVAGGADNASFVKTVYAHVVGSQPDSETAAYFQGMLDSAEMTQAELLTLAAETDANARFIDLIGLAHTGLEYV